MAGQHREEDQDLRSGTPQALPGRRAPAIPLGSAARWIEEEEGEPWSGRGFSFTRSARGAAHRAGRGVPPRRPHDEDDDDGGRTPRRSRR